MPTPKPKRAPRRRADDTLNPSITQPLSEAEIEELELYRLENGLTYTQLADAIATHSKRKYRMTTLRDIMRRTTRPFGSSLYPVRKFLAHTREQLGSKRATA